MFNNHLSTNFSILTVAILIKIFNKIKKREKKVKFFCKNILYSKNISNFVAEYFC